MLMFAAWKLESVKGHRILTTCGSYCSSLVWSNCGHPNLSQCFSAFLICLYRKVRRNVQEVPILSLNENLAFRFLLPYPVSTRLQYLPLHIQVFTSCFQAAGDCFDFFFPGPGYPFLYCCNSARSWLLVASVLLLRYFFILYICFFSLIFFIQLTIDISRTGMWHAMFSVQSGCVRAMTLTVDAVVSS